MTVPTKTVPADAIVLNLPDFYYDTAVPELRERSEYGATSYRLHMLLREIADQIEAQRPLPSEGVTS